MHVCRPRFRFVPLGALVGGQRSFLHVVDRQKLLYFNLERHPEVHRLELASNVSERNSLAMKLFQMVLAFVAFGDWSPAHAQGKVNVLEASVSDDQLSMPCVDCSVRVSLWVGKQPLWENYVWGASSTPSKLGYTNLKEHHQLVQSRAPSTECTLTGRA